MKIAFQGTKGAYMHMAAMKAFPECAIVPCVTFDQAFAAVQSGEADRAMIAIDNTVAGRVADVHLLLPRSGLFITGETFLPIHHCLMSVKGAAIDTITHVHSHVHALPQCQDFIQRHGYLPVVHSDTAGAAADIAVLNDPTQAAIASELAAELYGLRILAKSIQDNPNNKTRFVTLSREMKSPENQDNAVTAFQFRVRNVPAALYKVLGAFATSGVNMLKLESYINEDFHAAQFYCEVAAHMESQDFRTAIQEVEFFTSHLQIMGCFLMDR